MIRISATHNFSCHCEAPSPFRWPGRRASSRVSISSMRRLFDVGAALCDRPACLAFVDSRGPLSTKASMIESPPPDSARGGTRAGDVGEDVAELGVLSWLISAAEENIGRTLGRRPDPSSPWTIGSVPWPVAVGFGAGAVLARDGSNGRYRLQRQFGEEPQASARVGIGHVDPVLVEVRKGWSARATAKRPRDSVLPIFVPSALVSSGQVSRRAAPCASGGPNRCRP